MPDYFEDFEIGSTASSPVARTISETDVYTQAGLAGSYNPLHTDKEYMAESRYGRRLVQNTLLISIMSGLFRRLDWTPATIAAYGRDNMRFIEPVFIDDTVRLESEVIELRERDDETGVVTFRQELINHRDDPVLVGEYLLLIERRP